MTMQKRIILGLFVGLLTVLCMSLYTYCNLKFNSVYYAQHIPHIEGDRTGFSYVDREYGMDLYS